MVVCSCFDVCWSFGVAGWGGIREGRLKLCSCFDVCWSFGVAGWGGIREGKLKLCSCFDVCWSFGVAGWGGIREGRLKLCFSLPSRIPPQPATPKLQHTSKQEHTTSVVIQ